MERDAESKKATFTCRKKRKSKPFLSLPTELCRKIEKSSDEGTIVSHAITPSVLPQRPASLPTVCCAIKIISSPYAERFGVPVKSAPLSHCEESDLDVVMVARVAPLATPRGWLRQHAFLSVSQDELSVGDTVVLRVDFDTRRAFIINRTQRRLVASRVLPALPFTLSFAVSARATGTRFGIVPAAAADYRAYTQREIDAVRATPHNE